MTSTDENTLAKMQYVRLGNTGMKVSKICMGCANFGSNKWQSWIKDENEGMAVIKCAYDVGINFFDTADQYSAGESERILGRAIKEYGFQRSKLVIATKVFYPFVDGKPEVSLYGTDPEKLGYVNQGGLSRKHIFEAVEASLARLQLDYIDLYQIHRFDPDTPIEETMEALHDLVRSGKVRYIGASSMAAWQFQKMNNIAEKNRWTKFVTMQNFYNILYREEEREMAPYCLDANIGWIPWSPLAGGKLARRITETTPRGESGFLGIPEYESDAQIINRIWDIAEKYDATAAQIALAWHWTKPFVTAPILGMSKVKHVHDLVGAFNIKLTDEDIKYIEELYTPRKVFGF